MTRIARYQPLINIPTGEVRIFKNLHNGAYSIETKKAGAWRVIGHSHTICLSNVTFFVSQKGRERVLQLNKKKPHAYVMGIMVPELPTECTIRVTYNPYKYSSFVLCETLTPIAQAKWCYLSDDGVFIPG